MQTLWRSKTRVALCIAYLSPLRPAASGISGYGHIGSERRRRRGTVDLQVRTGRPQYSINVPLAFL